MPLLPLHQDDLRHQQRGDQDEHHLGVHGLVTPVLHVEPLVLHSGARKTAVGWKAAAQWVVRESSRKGLRACVLAQNGQQLTSSSPGATFSAGRPKTDTKIVKESRRTL